MRSRSGFTLLEVMIVVLVIAVLVAIAVPNFISARVNSQRKSCISSLRLLDGAKEQWAMETKAPAGATVTMADLTTGGYLRGPATGPQCPTGGVYTLRAIGETPQCSRNAAPDNHVLP
jgi:prepilin-type N-terminal cleavage/methylation domain-containing protein